MTFKQFISSPIKAVREECEKRRRQETYRKSRESVTLAEHNGSCYIAVDGIPTVPARENWEKTLEMMQDMRAARYSYLASLS